MREVYGSSENQAYRPKHTTTKPAAAAAAAVAVATVKR